ncbi:MAG TPA: hypothetical protein VHY37_08810 [Tepidisphaeraceae bacterium]|jgi:hypothetical protein|nr:hypothetical protein [Tepidisphaeraceae bacterium]
MREADLSQSSPKHDPWDTIGASNSSLAGPGSDDAGTTALAVISQRGAEAPVPPSAPSTYTGSGWTIPLLSFGLGLIACCILIPQADANRRLAYEKQLLQADLTSVKQQAKINGIFLKRVADDPALAERLAERQMKMIRAGSKILPLEGSATVVQGPDMSPFQITAVAPPPPAPPYHSIGGPIASFCYDSGTRIYLIGAALLAIAAGLVLGQARW